MNDQKGCSTEVPKEPTLLTFQDTDENVNKLAGKHISRDEIDKLLAQCRLGADPGSAEAQFILGRCYEFGIGVDKDLKEAAKYYWLAEQNAKHAKQDGIIKLVQKKLKKPELATRLTVAKEEIKVASSGKRCLDVDGDNKNDFSVPDQITLYFITPNQHSESWMDRKLREKFKKDHPNSEWIFVDIDDFDKTGLIKPGREYKYRILKRATEKTKIKLHGHGSVSSPYISNNIHERFSVQHIRSLLMLTQVPLVKRVDDALLLPKKKYEPLRISIHACAGETFAQALANDLFDISTEKKEVSSILPFEITAGKKNHLLFINLLNGSKSYPISRWAGFFWPKKNHDQIIMLNGLALIVTVCCSLSEGPSRSDGYCMLALALILASLYLLSNSVHEKSNTADKVVFTPDYDDLSTFSSVDYRFRLYSAKKYFKEEYKRNKLQNDSSKKHTVCKKQLFNKYKDLELLIMSGAFLTANIINLIDICHSISDPFSTWNQDFKIGETNVHVWGAIVISSTVAVITLAAIYKIHAKLADKTDLIIPDQKQNESEKLIYWLQDATRY